MVSCILGKDSAIYIFRMTSGALKWLDGSDFEAIWSWNSIWGTGSLGSVGRAFPYLRLSCWFLCPESVFSPSSSFSHSLLLPYSCLLCCSWPLMILCDLWQSLSPGCLSYRAHNCSCRAFLISLELRTHLCWPVALWPNCDITFLIVLYAFLSAPPSVPSHWTHWALLSGRSPFSREETFPWMYWVHIMEQKN